MEYIEKIHQASDYLRLRLQGSELPIIGIVLGSGLGLLADRIEDAVEIPYGEIPNFRKSTAIGHRGCLIVGQLGGKRVMAMQGRFHYYEGYTMQEVTFPIRVMADMGIKTLFVSNAAGAMNPTYKVGDMMVIADHISFMPNPLIGANLDDFGERFPDMTTVYSRRIRQIAMTEAAAMGLELQQGVYVAETGPCYETPAEYRMYAALGGDVVGMSTVPEVIVARHCKMEIFGMSIVTNQSADLREDCLNSGDDVVKAANAAAANMSNLFERIIQKI